MGTSIVTELKRVDIYEENEVDKIVNAQNSRPAQAFPPATITGMDTDYKVRVYAVTTKERIPKNYTIDTLSDMHVLGRADFTEEFAEKTIYHDRNKYDAYAPVLSGSIRLTFEKKKA